MSGRNLRVGRWGCSGRHWISHYMVEDREVDRTSRGGFVDSDDVE